MIHKTNDHRQRLGILIVWKQAYSVQKNKGKLWKDLIFRKPTVVKMMEVDNVISQQLQCQWWLQLSQCYEGTRTSLAIPSIKLIIKYARVDRQDLREGRSISLAWAPLLSDIKDVAYKCFPLCEFKSLSRYKLRQLWIITTHLTPSQRFSNATRVLGCTTWRTWSKYPTVRTVEYGLYLGLRVSTL